MSVVGIAVLTFFVWGLFGPQLSWVFGLINAAAIENMRKITVLVVDKTGTLTEGKPSFERAVGVSGMSADDVLRYAATLDQVSEHPLAKAMVSAAKDRQLVIEKPVGFNSVSGIGVSGSVAGHSLVLENTALMEQSGVSVGALIQEELGDVLNFLKYFFYLIRNKGR